MHKTPNQIAFEREAKRVERAIARIEQRGFEFTEKPSLTKPSRVTKKALARLQSIKPETLYAKTEYTLPSGEKISGETRRAQERSAAAIKAAQTRKMKAAGGDAFFEAPPKIAEVITKNATEELEKVMSREMYDATKAEFESWSFDKIWKAATCDRKEADKNRLQGMFGSFVSQAGANEIAQRLEANAEVWFNAVSVVLYWYRSEEPVNQAFATIATILRGKALTAEESKRFTDMAEFSSVGG